MIGDPSSGFSVIFLWILHSKFLGNLFFPFIGPNRPFELIVGIFQMVSRKFHQLGNKLSTFSDKAQMLVYQWVSQLCICTEQKTLVCFGALNACCVNSELAQAM